MTADDYLRHVVRCSGCGDRWCMVHEQHWADCTCPGPHVCPGPDDLPGRPLIEVLADELDSEDADED